MWEVAPAGQQARCVEPWTLDRSQLGHCVSVSGDDEVFPGKHSVHDFSAVIAEFSNGHCSHESIVSRVRRAIRCGRSDTSRSHPYLLRCRCDEPPVGGRGISGSALRHQAEFDPQSVTIGMG